jgi:hypothetical protein
MLCGVILSTCESFSSVIVMQMEADVVMYHASKGTVGQRVAAASYGSKHQRLHMPPMPLRYSTLQPPTAKGRD